MEYAPPPFFRRGPAPIVRLAFFVSLSLALLALDARLRLADGLRSVLATLVYPLQRAAIAPVDLASRIAAHFAAQVQLQQDNEQLRARLVELARDAQRLQAALAENAELRRLIGAAERLPVGAMPAEILYAGRDPYARRVLVDKGERHGVRPGSPVVDETGVVGQVTRVHPLAAEVTLLTDKDHAIPVRVVRNGLRAIAFGAGASGLLELRYLAANAEIQTGDLLVTSGLDGVYPAGLPVATVMRIERDAANAFARVYCEPAAGVERGSYVLLLVPQHREAPAAGALDARKTDAPRGRRRGRVGGDG